MGKYIKKFATHSAYSAAESLLIKPNVSLCVQENEVHYNPYVHDYADDYLTFVALESGTFTFTPKSTNKISYSTDNGTTWTQGNSVAVNSGDKVLWKGTMTPVEYQGIGVFSSTAEFDTQGNIMSLLFGDNYNGQTSLTGKDDAFVNLFKNNEKVINSENLTLPATTAVYDCYTNMFEGCTSLVNTPALPATTLEDFCYMGMFKGCTSLTTAPELPATTLSDSCYKNMFNGCTNLNSITCLATDISEIGCTQNWVSGVAANGTFTKAASMSSWTTGNSGIPTGWTVETAS